MPSFVEPTAAATEAVVNTTVPVEAPAAQATEAPVVIPTESGPATCEAGFSVLTPPDAATAALAAAIPPVTDADWSRGNPDAKYTIIEYSDFMCPYCAAISPVLQDLLTSRPDDVRLVFRHFPLPSHPLSMLGTQAAEAAGLQGKFWEVADYLLQNQAEWSTMDEPAFEAYLLDKAESWKLDKAQFTKDLGSAAMVKKATDALDAANKAGITYTPFLMLNDRVLQGGEIQNLGLVIHLLSSQESNYKDCPPTLLDPAKTYTATIETAKGNIVVKLFADKAPLAVNSFVFLAREGWYDNLPFNDIVKDTAENGYQIAIAGDHTGTGYGSAGYQIGLENLDGKYDRKGLVGMVNASQFFLTFAPQPALDGHFSVIGEVVEGMDVLEGLPVTATADGQLAPAETILKVSITES
jgi:cyclophilin family peptidyl-prolyl cis-trans isomerase/protein-disulfide isomerase